MENQLQHSQHGLSTPLNGKEIEIAKIIYHVNQLVTYPLNDRQIEDWTKTINQLYSKLDLVVLLDIITDMKLDKIDWDHRKGIQNITKALSSKGIYDDAFASTLAEINQQSFPNKSRMVY